MEVLKSVVTSFVVQLQVELLKATGFSLLRSLEEVQVKKKQRAS